MKMRYGPSRAPLVLLFMLLMGVSALVADQRGAGRGGPQAPEPSILEDGDFTIRPPFSNSTDLLYNNSVPHGTVHRFTMKSVDSKIYKGSHATSPERSFPTNGPSLFMFRPSTCLARRRRSSWFRMDTTRNITSRYRVVLDNLIAQKKLPVMIAVLVQHGGGDGPGSERGLEYDTVSGTYTDFIETEVLPRVQHDYKVTLTKDPEGRATMGGSSGAACAMAMAWFHPELYRKVLSYSGTFVNQARPSTELAPRGAWEYHATFVPNSEKKPIRIWMEVGEFDNGAAREESTWGNWIIANKNMAAALKAKGYSYRFVYAEGARHTDANVIYQTLPQALQWLWQGYPIK